MALRPANPLHVIIIGAGLGGLALAHGLRRAGVSGAVYDAEVHRRERAGGNAGEINPEHWVSEQTLRQLLLARLEGRVYFGKEFTRLEQQADGTVTAFFADASCASGQLLVAADGAHCAVRAQYPRQMVPPPPVPVRRPRNITLVGGAIHATAPGQRAGANIALRDALLLSHALSAVQAGRVSLLNGIAAYESEMKRRDSLTVAEDPRPTPGPAAPRHNVFSPGRLPGTVGTRGS
jgi:2-polyprenyl-6-methoxyphenol hydroxylase-like FAD-dependent oxidoreductase